MQPAPPDAGAPATLRSTAPAPQRRRPHPPRRGSPGSATRRRSTAGRRSARPGGLPASRNSLPPPGRGRPAAGPGRAPDGRWPRRSRRPREAPASPVPARSPATASTQRPDASGVHSAAALRPNPTTAWRRCGCSCAATNRIAAETGTAPGTAPPPPGWRADSPGFDRNVRSAPRASATSRIASPAASRAASSAPADVPTSRSAFQASPPSASPSSTPTCQASPVRPPLPSTRARRDVSTTRFCGIASRPRASDWPTTAQEEALLRRFFSASQALGQGSAADWPARHTGARISMARHLVVSAIALCVLSACASPAQWTPGPIVTESATTVATTPSASPTSSGTAATPTAPAVPDATGATDVSSYDFSDFASPSGRIWCGLRSDLALCHFPYGMKGQGAVLEHRVPGRGPGRHRRLGRRPGQARSTSAAATRRRSRRPPASPSPGGSPPATRR